MQKQEIQFIFLFELVGHKTREAAQNFITAYGEETR